MEVSGFGNKPGDVDWYRVQISGTTATTLIMNIDFVRPQASGSTEMGVYSSFPVTEDPKIGLLTLQPINKQLQRFSTAIRPE